MVMENAGSPINSLKLSGAEKAAAMLLMMGKDSAAKLAEFFSREDLDRVVSAATKLKKLDLQTIDVLVDEFGNNYVNQGLVANMDEIVSIFTDQPKQEEDEGGFSFEEEEVEENRVEVDPELLLEFFQNEPPMITAFLLSTLQDDLGAKVLTELDQDKRNTIFKAYLERKPIDPATQELLKTDLIDLIQNSGENEVNSEQIEKAAGLINYFSDDASNDLVSFVESDSPETAAIIRKSMFKFNSLVSLQKPERALIFDAIGTDDIVKSLGNADNAVRECVLDVLSQRNRRMVESELGRIAVEAEESEAVQRKISSVVLKLVKEGKVILPDAA